MARCRLQHSEGAPRRPPHSGPVAVCDIREAAGRERVASTAGNRPLFYFRFGERTFLRERGPPSPSALHTEVRAWRRGAWGPVSEPPVSR